MQFEVAGTQGGTGLARSIVVNADDAAQARRLGARQGWKVESVHPVDEPGTPTAPRAMAVAPTVEPAAVPTVAPPRVDPALGRVADRSRKLDVAAIVIGVLGGLFVFAGVLLVGCAAALVPAPARPGPSLITGLATGLPVIAAGVMQLVTAVAVHVLSELARAVARRAETPARMDPDASEAGKI